MIGLTVNKTKQEALIKVIVATLPADIKVNIFPKDADNGCTVHFKNEYGASIITNGLGEEDGLYELAVLNSESIDYTTPITSDVIGYRTKSDIVEILVQINKLQPRD